MKEKLPEYVGKFCGLMDGINVKYIPAWHAIQIEDLQYSAFTPEFLKDISANMVKVKEIKDRVTTSDGRVICCRDAYEVVINHPEAGVITCGRYEWDERETAEERKRQLRDVISFIKGEHLEQEEKKDVCKRELD